MPGLIEAWKDASVGQKIGVITASSLAVGGVVYGIYRLKTQEEKPPPRPSTPVRRVDPFESVPKTPPKTLPKPKLSMPAEKDPEALNLSEKAEPQTPPTSPVAEDHGPLSSSTASFEPISMSQVPSMRGGGDADAPVSMPRLNLVPQDVQLGGSLSSASSTSPGTADSSMSFVKLSMPPEKATEEEAIQAENTQQSFAAAPPPPPMQPDTPPAGQSSQSVTPSTADTSTSFVNLSREDMEPVMAQRVVGERAKSVEEELEELKLRRARAEEAGDDEAPDDGTTMATIGSDSEHTVEEEYEPDFEDDDDDEEGSQSGESDIQRLDDDEPEVATPEPLQGEETKAEAAGQAPSTQASASDGRLKEKDENDIVVISTDDKEEGK